MALRDSSRAAAPPAEPRGSKLVMASALALAGRIADTLEAIRDNTNEQESDFDTTYVLGGTLAAAAVLELQLPRTVHHAEITLTAPTSDNTKFAALFDGQVVLPDAQNRHNPAAGGSSSGAICVSNGGSVTVRDYLSGQGYLTVFFTGAATIYACVRVRDLDRTQSRQRRT